MARIDLQHALVDLAAEPPSPILSAHSEAACIRTSTCSVGLASALRAPLEDVDGLLPARLLREQPLEGRQRAEVAGIELQHLAPGVDRVLRPHQGLALELAELREQLLELVGSMPLPPSWPTSIRRRSDCDSSSQAPALR